MKNQFSFSHLFSPTTNHPQTASNVQFKQFPAPDQSTTSSFEPVIQSDSEQFTLNFLVDHCDSLAILPSNNHSNSTVTLPPISSLFSIIYNHHHQVRSESLEQEARSQSFEVKPLILLLSGRNQSDFKDEIRNGSNRWLKNSLRGGQGYGEMEKVLKDLEIRYFKSPTHLISFLSLLRTSLSINSTNQELEYNFNLDSSLDWLPKDSITKGSTTKDEDELMKDPNQKQVEINDKSTEVDDVTMDLDESEHSDKSDSNQRSKEKTSSTLKESKPTSKEIPIPDFSKVTSQHERVLMFDRRPTLIILEGLTEMFQRGLNDENQSPTVDEFSMILQHTFDLLNHLKTSNFNPDPQSINQNQFEKTQLILFDQNKWNLSLPIMKLPSNQTYNDNDNLKIPLKKIIDQFFDFILTFENSDFDSLEEEEDSRRFRNPNNATQKRGDGKRKGKMVLKDGVRFDDLKLLKELREKKKKMGLEEDLKGGFELKLGFEVG